MFCYHTLARGDFCFIIQAQDGFPSISHYTANYLLIVLYTSNTVQYWQRLVTPAPAVKLCLAGRVLSFCVASWCIAILRSMLGGAGSYSIIRSTLMVQHAEALYT